jgi:acyl phosphate:glycerol-3-phosphate acyltransferase
VSSTALALVAGSYLLGSISFAYLLVRTLTGHDIRNVGSGNAGATNTLRAAGPTAGMAALTLDFAKGVVPVLVARAVGMAPEVAALAATAAVLGHVSPVFLGFRGGKGVATAAGALGVLAPAAAALSALVFLVLVSWTRYVSLGSVGAALSFPAFVALAGAVGWSAPHNPAFVAVCTLIPVLVVFRHRTNLRRLWSGTERRLGEERAGVGG